MKKQQEIALIKEQINAHLLAKEEIENGIYRFTKIGTSSQKRQQTLMDAFVNAISPYDNHTVIMLTYKDNTKTITFDDLEGSYSSSVSAPRPPRTNVLGGLGAKRRTCGNHVRGFTPPTRILINRFTKPL